MIIVTLACPAGRLDVRFHVSLGGSSLLRPEVHGRRRLGQSAPPIGVVVCSKQLSDLSARGGIDGQVGWA